MKQGVNKLRTVYQLGTEYLLLETMSEALVRSGTNMGEGASIAPEAGSGTRGGVPEWKGAGTTRRGPG
jgi:hypothetical protein